MNNFEKKLEEEKKEIEELQNQALIATNRLMMLAVIRATSEKRKALIAIENAAKLGQFYS